MRWSKWHLPKLLPLRSFQRTDPGLGIEPCQEGGELLCGANEGEKTSSSPAVGSCIKGWNEGLGDWHCEALKSSSGIFWNYIHNCYHIK